MNPRWVAAGRFFLGLGIVLVANIAAGWLARGALFSARRFDLLYRPLICVLLLAGFSVLLTAIDRVQENPLAAMGLGRRGPWLREVAIGLVIGVGIITIAVTAISITGQLTFQIRFNSHTVLLSAAVLIILLTGALAEELSFRGYPFQRLVEAVGATAAVVLFSVLFGAAHLLNPHTSVWAMLNTVLVGVLLSLAYLRTRRLWMPWAIHFGWNLTLGLIFGLPVSGLNEFSVIIRGRADGPQWLTGGSYGIEASAVGAIVVALAILGMLVAGQRRKQEQPPAKLVEPVEPPSTPA